MAQLGSAFRKIVNADSIAALEAELDADQARFDDLFSRYGRIRDELASLHDRIERQRKVLEVVRNALPADGLQATDGGRERGPAMTKREIATEILSGSIEPLFPRQVRRVAIERGWLTSGKDAANQLSVAMAKGVRTGVFVRDDDGRYSLPEHGDRTKF
jgi:hypothetical protein